MKKEAKEFLDFFEQNFSNSSVEKEQWKQYIHRLPIIYKTDLEFRLLFDWHWNILMNVGRAGIRRAGVDIYDERFVKQVNLITLVGRTLYDLDYQYRELILFHTRVNLRGATLLEIGGALPNQLLFDELEIKEYINIESPDYIDADKGQEYSQKYSPDNRKRTIICNAESISEKIAEQSIDYVFSVACFEHILNLPKALSECFKCTRKGGVLFTYFSPIYSFLEEGDHGVIPTSPYIKEKPIGIHLLSHTSQRQKLISYGIKDPNVIQEFLGSINFNRIPNRLMYEDYERILTESPYTVLELDRIDSFNLAKKYPEIIKEIRASNSSIGNLMTSGFRSVLIKG